MSRRVWIKQIAKLKMCLQDEWEQNQDFLRETFQGLSCVKCRVEISNILFEGERSASVRIIL